MSLAVLIRGHCNDCGNPHGRGPVAALCFPCRKQRERAREGTERYLEYQRRYNRSPRGKIRRGLWYERNAQVIAVRQAAAYQRRRAAAKPSVWHCETWGCPNEFIRIRGSHRQFCTECQLLYYGPSYLRSLERRRRRSKVQMKQAA